MYIHVVCENGHRIKAMESLAGQTHGCPKCGKPVMIPVPVKTESAAITDTGVMRILGDASPVPPQPELAVPTVKLRTCPRCNQEVSLNASVCKACQCYLEVAPDMLFRMRVAANQGAPRTA